MVAYSGADVFFLRNDIIEDLNYEIEYLNDVYNLKNSNPYEDSKNTDQNLFKTNYWIKSQDIL
jgi:hypothetical protein